jgi:putative flippase GtrA
LIKEFTTNIGDHVPPGQVGRYLLVGVWNTIFGYLSFAALTAMLSSIIPYSYLAASLLASLVNITMAFLLYKHLVFRTKGNYWREWTRCLLVYSSGIALNLALLPVIVQLIRQKTPYGSCAPYLAGALLTGCGMIYNFFGHKKFSFGRAL